MENNEGRSKESRPTVAKTYTETEPAGKHTRTGKSLAWSTRLPKRAHEPGREASSAKIEQNPKRKTKIAKDEKSGQVLIARTEILNQQQQHSRREEHNFRSNSTKPARKNGRDTQNKILIFL
jgi:hypothetical protein